MVRPLDFTSRLTHPLPGLWDHVRALGSLLRPLRPSTLADARRIPRVAPRPLDPVGSRDLSVTWLGHSTCLVRMSGMTVLTDPVLSRSIAGVRRITPPGLDVAHLGRIDAILVSHDHFDHLDWPTLRRLPRSTPVFCGAGLARAFRRRGFHDVESMDWWEEATLGPLTISFVPAHHWSGRSLLRANTTLWGGWVVGDGRRKVYFAGDTAYGPCFKAIREVHPGIDVALMPVGAYSPRWYNGTSHVSPEEAVLAARDVGAKAMVPIHWGTFLLSGEPVLEPIERTRAAWAEADLPARDLVELPIGGTATLRPSRVPAVRSARPRRRRKQLLVSRAYAA